MDVYDGKNHSGGAYEQYFHDLILCFLNGEERHWGVLSWSRLPELNLPNESEYEAATVAFFTRLRAFVDGSLITGIDSNGIETPSSRRIRASVGEARIMTVSEDEAPVVIFDEIYESWLRNPPRPLLNGDGTTAIAINQPRWKSQDLQMYARDMAAHYFQELLSSPLWTRLGKCTNPTCKRYFLRKRQAKAAIKRGSYCGSCKLIGGAERTRASRQRLKHEMLRVAAEGWREWGVRVRCSDRTVWVASRVNKKFGKANFIHPKWVNQNRKAIQVIADMNKLATTK